MRPKLRRMYLVFIEEKNLARLGSFFTYTLCTPKKQNFLQYQFTLTYKILRFICLHSRYVYTYIFMHEIMLNVYVYFKSVTQVINILYFIHNNISFSKNIITRIAVRDFNFFFNF